MLSNNSFQKHLRVQCLLCCLYTIQKWAMVCKLWWLMISSNWSRMQQLAQGLIQALIQESQQLLHLRLHLEFRLQMRSLRWETQVHDLYRQTTQYAFLASLSKVWIKYVLSYFQIKFPKLISWLRQQRMQELQYQALRVTIFWLHENWFIHLDYLGQVALRKESLPKRFQISGTLYLLLLIILIQMVWNNKDYS